MPDTLAPPRRRQRAAESDSDDDEASSEGRDGTTFSHTSNGSKRVRLSTGRNDRESEASEESSSEEDDSDEDRKDETLVTRALRDTSENAASSSNGHHGGSRNPGMGNAVGKGLEHLPGSIVRVKLTNFVTYTSAECHPGPRLNMVIGPNGTGKSTFVCAICLGLGWGPSYLGRAKDVAEFVKHGADEATIEIELKARADMDQNPIICRTIKREGNKSTFSINGKPVRQNVVLSLAKSFSIQIDNLCQFLPQDKVSEFAALSPIDLLHSTQRAAAGPEMVKWHDGLKELRSGQKEILEESKGQREHLANLEKRQQMQREDVERMKQREEIKKRLKFLEMSRPLPRFNSCKKETSEVLEQKQRLLREQQELERKLEPALRAVNSKRAYYSKIEAVLKQKRVLSQRGEEAATAISEKLVKIDDKIKDLSNQIEAEKQNGGRQVEECKRVQQSINRLQRQMEEEAVDFDGAAYSEKIRDCVRRIREVEEKAREIQARKSDTVRKVETHKRKIANAEQRLIDLKSQSGQQEEKLKRLSDHSSKAWEWIKQNQDKFDKRVYGPPIVECSVKDPRYASAAESLLQRNDFIAFTTQSREDFRKLQRFLNQELGLHDISIKTCTVSLSSMSPPVTDEDLRSLRFDGWAKDYLDGPEPVLAMLCSENRFHQTAVTLRDISDEEYRKLERGTITTWVAGKQAYQVIRRHEYGPSATTTRVRQLWPARIWTDTLVDSSSTERDLMNCISEWKQELSEILASGEEERSTLQRLKGERDAASGEKDELEREKAEKQSAMVNYNALPTKLAQQKEKLKVCNTRVEGIRDRVEALRDKQDELAVEKAAVALEYSAAVVSLAKTLEEVARVEILAIEAMSDVSTLEERNAEYTGELSEKTAAVEQVVRKLDELRDKLRTSKAEVRAVVSQMGSTPGLREVSEEVKDHTIEQLEADIDSEKARLELTHEGSGNVIQEFEQRQLRIDQLKEQLSLSEERLAAIEQSIKEIRSEWEPRLDAIVSKISDAFADNFARIGCAGQVSVDKNEGAGNDVGPGSDFDQWSIKIQVKFREHEELSILDSHRQSGGERAVSTIFYLMALQSLSASPFRVVDEINQGMDPRNERMVHERMVDIACGQADSGTTGGQYFLITPKLLGGLVYKPGMTVLCIFSGEFMPEDYTQLDFQRCVLRMKEVKAQQGLSEKARGKRAMVG